MFKKRQPKYKPINEDDPWITKVWNTQRGRAGIKLAFYGIFVVFVFLLIIFKHHEPPKKFVSTYKSNEKSYSTKIDELRKNNFSYKYIITNQDEKISYQGRKMLNLESGYKEDSTGIIKYLKENDMTYKLGINDEKEEYSDLYLNVNPNYLSVNYIFDLINNHSYEIQDKTYIYPLEEGKMINILTDSSHILKITINDNEIIYDLEFKDIGKIEDINLEY